MSIQLSFSASQKYIMSPKAYYLHYIARIRPIELSSPLFFGSALDIGLNSLLEGVNDKKVDKDRAKEQFVTAWQLATVNDKQVDLSVPGTIKYSKADYDESILTSDDKFAIETTEVDPSWVSLKRKGLIMIDAYNDQVIPRIKKVHFIQKYIKLDNEFGDALVGYIDFCATLDDDKTYILDNKSSSIKYADDASVNSEQLSTYYEALKDELHIDGAGYVVIPKKIRKQKEPLCPIEIQVGPISEELIQKTFTMYDTVLEGIRKQEFHCTRSQVNGCCSMPWPCSYKKFCASGDKDMTGLIVHDERKK